ncbi:MAG: LamG-like jellyroll fold domain-containing protein [Phycisphaerae bacterium]|nr:LamG-like jellyroll fold domain-containing protein [Tepidisphaeraceae bacterium]
MKFSPFQRVGIAAVVGLAAASSPASAAVIGYWQFEDVPGYLADSGPGGRTLALPGGTADPAQVTLPTTGPGSAFVNAVPTTAKAASFDGSDRFERADEPAFTDTTFSAEALINGSNFESITAQKSIIGQWNSTGNQRSWLLAVNGSGANAKLNLLVSTNGSDTVIIPSGLPALAANTDYYVGVTVDLSDTSDTGVTFYQKDLSTGDVSIAGVAHAATTLKDSASDLTIGSTDQPSSQFTGLIDQVRYSDEKLAPDQLLVAVPEPGTAGLLGVLAVGALARRRRK